MIWCREPVSELAHAFSLQILCCLIFLQGPTESSDRSSIFGKKIDVKKN